MRAIISCLIAFLFLAAAWEVGASWLWSQVTEDPFTLTGWWQARPLWSADIWHQVLLSGTASISGLFTLGIGGNLALLALRYRQRRPLQASDDSSQPLRRGASGNHGTARFGSPQEVRRDFARPAHGHGIVIGALDNTPGAPLLYDNLDQPGNPGHSLTIAGSGGGKTTTDLTRLWLYRGPRVVLDPSNELGPLMTEALQNTGYNVYTIGAGKHGVNVLDWIDPTSLTANADVATAVGHIFDEKGVQANTAGGGSRDPTWSIAARSLITCLLSHVVFSGRPFSLNDLRAGLECSDTEMSTRMAYIAENSKSARARYLANKLRDTNKSEPTWASLMFTAGAATGWLSDDVYAGVVSGNSLKTRDILDPKTVVFVDLPLRTLIATPAIGRAVVGSLLNTVLHADGEALRHRVLFDLEEGAVLGAMDEILLYYRTARKYGGLVHYSIQSDADLTFAWGEERASIIRSCCSWISYNAVRDPAAAKRLSDAMGSHGVVARSVGSNRGSTKPWGFNLPNRSRGDVENEHEIKHSLCSPDDILRSPADRMWVLAQDKQYVVDCATAPYYRYPSIAGRMDTSRFNYKRQSRQSSPAEL